jgi:uncharacterized protein (DUF362 family)
MKNMFGIVPGMRYGWPKNILHWVGIQESVLDICATVPIRFVIADGIVAMEGNVLSTVLRGNFAKSCSQVILLQLTPLALD